MGWLLLKRKGDGLSLLSSPCNLWVTSVGRWDHPTTRPLWGSLAPGCIMPLLIRIKGSSPVPTPLGDGFLISRSYCLPGGVANSAFPPLGDGDPPALARDLHIAKTMPAKTPWESANGAKLGHCALAQFPISGGIKLAYCTNYTNQ